MADGGGVIDNLTIQNFRLFESLEVKGIKRVNLIVGRNNAGKSALLEAVYLYFSRFSLGVILRILQMRQEVVNTKMSGAEHFSNLVLRHIFKNHSFPLELTDNIKIGSDNEYCYEVCLVQIKGQGYQVTSLNEMSKTLNFEQVNVKISAFYRSQDMGGSSFPIERPLDEKAIKEDLFWSTFKGKYIQIRYVPTLGLLDQNTAQLWDSISLTSAQDDVIKAFHIIEPNITGLSFIAADNESNNRIPIVKLKDMPEPIPLKSLGDGMTRLFHIILSLVTAKDGVLLIDEFENGLHWSTQTKAWELIFILAKQWNVQVFCTTHSKDCINSFEDVWTQNPEDAAFFRLYRKENQSHIKAYDLEMLSDAIETETEVR